MKGSPGSELKSAIAILLTPFSLISPDTFIVTGMVGVEQPATMAATAPATAVALRIVMSSFILKSSFAYLENFVSLFCFAPDSLTAFFPESASSTRLAPAFAVADSGLALTAFA